MPSSDEARRWIAAAAALAQDAGAKVSCPACGGADLEVIEVTWPDGSHVDRYLSCPRCGARNTMTIVSPTQTNKDQPSRR